MRRALALLAALVLAGCVSGAPQTQSRPHFYTVGDAGGAGKRLIPYTTLAGYLQRSKTRDSGLFLAVTGAKPDRAVFTRPMAVAAGPQGVYVIDEASNALYRFRWDAAGADHATTEHRASSHDGLTHAELSRLSSLPGIDEPTDLFVTGNGDVYLADGNGRKVVRYSMDGDEQQRFEDDETLNRPVAVTVANNGLRVLVADGLFDRVVVFNPAGRALYGIGSRGDEAGDFRNIRGMVQARDGMLYVVDGIHRRINVYGLDGSFLTGFGQSTFTDPGGIAVDDEGRVYLTDRFNHRILVFRNRQLVETYGSQGPEPGQFNQPSGMSYHDGKLYVADRDNSRVQVFRVVPEKLAKEGGP